MAIGLLVGWFARRAWDQRNVEFYRAQLAHRENQGFYPTTLPPNDESPPQSQERVFVTLTLADMKQIFEGKTTREAKVMAKSYTGRWVKLSGSIDDIDEPEYRDDGSCSVRIGDDDPEQVPWVSLNFEQEWKRTIIGKRRGDQISVIGQIDRLERYSLDLIRCELVEPD